jgi:hypothetical protein
MPKLAETVVQKLISHFEVAFTTVVFEDNPS